MSNPVRRRPYLSSGGYRSGCENQTSRESSFPTLPRINNNSCLVTADLEPQEYRDLTDIPRTNSQHRAQVPTGPTYRESTFNNKKCLPPFPRRYLPPNERYTCDKNTIDKECTLLQPQIFGNHNSCAIDSCKKYKLPQTLLPARTYVPVSCRKNARFRRNGKLTRGRVDWKPHLLVSKSPLCPVLEVRAGTNNFDGFSELLPRLGSHTPSFEKNMNCSANQDNNSDNDAHEDQAEDISDDWQYRLLSQSKTETKTPGTPLEARLIISEFLTKVVGQAIKQVRGKKGEDSAIQDDNFVRNLPQSSHYPQFTKSPDAKTDGRETLFQACVSEFIAENERQDSISQTGEDNILQEDNSFNSLLQNLHYPKYTLSPSAKDPEDSVDIYFLAAISVFVALVEARAIRQLQTEESTWLETFSPRRPGDEMSGTERERDYDSAMPTNDGHIWKLSPKSEEVDTGLRETVNERKFQQHVADVPTGGKSGATTRFYDNQVGAQPATTEKERKELINFDIKDSLANQRQLEFGKFEDVMQVKGPDERTGHESDDESFVNQGSPSSGEDSDSLSDPETPMESTDEEYDTEDMALLKEQLRSGHLIIGDKVVDFRSIKIRRRKKKRRRKKVQIKKKEGRRTLYRPSPFSSYVKPDDYLPIPALGHLPSYTQNKLPVPWGVHLPQVSDRRDTPDAMFFDLPPSKPDISDTIFSYQKAMKHYYECQLQREGHIMGWP